MTGRKIVVDDDVVSFAAQNVGSVTANVSGSPNDENGQSFLPERPSIIKQRTPFRWRPPW
jgi:hypothetical protein